MQAKTKTRVGCLILLFWMVDAPTRSKNAFLLEVTLAMSEIATLPEHRYT